MKKTRSKRKGTSDSNNIIWLLAILAIAILLRFNHVSEPLGGMLGYNEGLYMQLGKSSMDNPLAYPRTYDGKIDYLIQPLYPIILGINFRILGFTESTARLTNIIFGLSSIILVYLIGRKIHDVKTGLLAGLFYSVIPAAVIVDRMVQPDSLMLFLSLSSIYAYLHSKTRFEYTYVSGFLVGLSFLAKQPGALILPMIIAWESFKTGRLRICDKRVIIMIITAIFTVTPYFTYSILYNYEQYSMQATVPLTWMLTRRIGLYSVFLELFYGLSPLVFIIGALAIIKNSFGKGKRSLNWFLTVLWTGFFLFYNQHGYYLYPIVPFLSLLIAENIGVLDKRRMRVILVIIVISSLFYSLLILCGNKYGRNHFKKMGDVIEDDSVILVSGFLYGNYGPLMRYYQPGSKIINLDDALEKSGDYYRVGDDNATYILIHFSEYDMRIFQEAEETVIPIFSERYAPVFLGTVFYEVPWNIHYFRNGRLQMHAGLPTRVNGVLKLAKVTELYLIKLNLGDTLLNNNGSIEIKKMIN